MKNVNKKFRFRCESLPAFDEMRKYSCPEYETIVEKITDDGIRLEFVKAKYPYTQDYVNSFLDSTDYRLNLDSSLAASPRGNFQDISDLQRFASMSSSEQMSILEQVRKDYSELLKAASSSIQPPDVNIQSKE